MTPLLRSALLGSLFLSTVSAAAEVQTSIIGMVVDAKSWEPLAGVQVTISSAGKTEEPRVTDAEGIYRFPDLAPGTYCVTFRREGFKTFTRSEVELQQGWTIHSNAHLVAGTMDEGTEPTGRPPCCDDIHACSPSDSHPQEFIRRIAVTRPRPLHRVQEPKRDAVSDRDRTPSWMLSRMPVLVSDGTPQLVYRAPSADRWSPDFGI
jgi:hypothetical protein